MNLEEKLRKMLPDKRFNHSINVANCAKKIAKIYNVDEEKAYISGLIHDCAKYFTKEETIKYAKEKKIDLDEFEIESTALSHATIGASVAKEEFEIDDVEILNAIKYHTTGKEDMTMLEKIIFMADLIEEGRNFESVDILRNLTYNNKIDEALLMSFNNTIKLVIDKNKIIHPKTINARNYILKEILSNKK
jgi:predicted HD superfamily hydrolase involved in NAD metabolism